jgi:hypothetical protein
MLKNGDERTFKISGPCDASWDKMKGNDRVRVCEHCEKEVNNVSAMTRKEALRLVRNSGGNICLQYRVDTRTQRPIFIERLQRMAARSGVAAGALTASIALSGNAHAQTEQAPAAVVEVNSETRPGSGGSITGIVSDPIGAVVPFATVSLFNESTGVYLYSTANLEGYYEFKDVPMGSYKMKFEGGGLQPRELSSINIYETAMVRQDVQLALQQVGVVVEVGSNEETSSMSYGGVVVSFTTTNPLVLAALNDDLEDVKARVLMRAKVNVRDKGFNGLTALHIAVENGNLPMVQFLLEHGARTNIRDFRKRTALMMMDDDAKPELAEMLIRYGAKPSLVDKEGNNALMHLAEYDKPDILRLLVNSGIAIDAKNADGETALMIAADNDQEATVKALLEAGANANMTSADGKTAMERTTNDQVRSLLITYGAVARSN